MGNGPGGRGAGAGVGYKQAGVDLDAADQTLELISQQVASTYTPGVLQGLGAFGGLFELPGGYRQPVLVASTDGVGTKVMVASELDALEGAGRDLVNHCLNDILVQGAAPLFFLDYVASSKLNPAATARLVTGVAEACRAAGMALLGGETAEMPGVYQAGEFDLVGTIVGIVEKDAVVDGSSVRSGDVLLGLPSGGLQTNGFSLARAVLGGTYQEPFVAAGPGTVGAALLAPHRSFLSQVRPLLAAGLVKGMAHITGGGLPGNLPRCLPAGLGAVVRRGSWPEPPIFELIKRRGAVAEAEMFDVFNMGIGFVLVVAPSDVARARELAGSELFEIGLVEPGAGVRLV